MEPGIRDVATPFGSVRAELRGTGEPAALLLHGLSAHRRVWDPVLPFLAGRLSLCLPDLPGRGESEPRPELSHRLPDELRTLRAALASLGFQPAIVVGHSHGASLAAALAAADPGIRGLVLLAPVHPWMRKPVVLAPLRLRAVRRALAPALAPLRGPVAARVLRSACGPDRTPPRAHADRYARPYADPRRVRLLLRVLADWRPGELARHLPERPLVGRALAGAHDRRVGYRGPARLAGRLGFGFELLPAAGHVLPEEAPEAVAAAILQVARDLAGALPELEPEQRRALP